MWREFKLFGLRLLSLSLSLNPVQCIIIIWDEQDQHVLFPDQAWQVSEESEDCQDCGRIEDCCDRAMFELVLIICVATARWSAEVLVSDGGGEVGELLLPRQTGLLITTWHGGGGRPLSSGHKLQEITTNWCQSGPGSWLLFILTKPLIKQLQTFQPPPWASFNLSIPRNKISHLSPLTTEHVLTSDLAT